MRLRKWLRGSAREGRSSARNAAQSPGMTLAKLTGKVLFVVILAFLLLYALATEIYLLAVLASLLAGIMLRSVLPVGRFQDWVRGLYSGDKTATAYENVKRRFE